MSYLIAEDGPLIGLKLPFEDGKEWTIGRDPDASDFSLDDDTVSRRHARIYQESDGLYIKNLSKVNPTLVNDEEIVGARLLHEGDKIQVGGTIFRFVEEKKKSGYDDIFGGLDELPEPPKPEATAYDTIFEDTPADEIPFQLTPETPLMLKVIGGPNAGAEIGIEKGKSYVIGKDSSASDIVFQDLSVSRSHAKLSVLEDGTIELEDLGSKNGTTVNGSVVTGKQVVTPQDLIACGTTVFMIIDRDAPQETIYASPAAHVAPRAEEEEKTVAIDWKKQPVSSGFLLLGGSAAAVLLIAFLSFFALFRSEGIEIASKTSEEDIQEALEKFKAVQYSYNPASGKLFLAGHVLTPLEYQEMNYRLGGIESVISVEDNVVIDEGVWRVMNDVIANNSNWRAISIHSPEAGKFVANGYVPNAAEGAAFSEYLTVNFPYLDLLENRVVVEDNLSAEVQGRIIQKNLGGVTAQLTGGEVVLTGRYADTRESEYKDLVKELNRVKGVTSVKALAVAVKPSQAGIDVTSQYQVTGSVTHEGKGFGVVMNGRMYTLGDVVDGMKIVMIESSTVLLEKDGLKYKIDYTL